MQLLLLSSLLVLSSALCPYGAVYYAPNNLCYLTATLPAQWTAAESICQNLGGHLANIRNQEQNDFVHLAIETLTMSTFVGVLYEQGAWKYSDGTLATFTNFQKEAAPSSNHSVALMIKQQGGKWQIAVDKKDSVHPFVCELPACNGVTPAPSKLDQSSNTTGLRYGVASNSWFYGSLYDSSIMETASANCESAAGHLATIRNAFENTEFVEISRDFFGQSAFNEVPIGYRSSGTGTWSWDDHSNSTYTNWAIAQPLLPIDSRSIVKPLTSEWYTRSDILNRPYICQFRVNAPTTCS